VIVKAKNVSVIERGSGITTLPLITREVTQDARFTTGMSTYPPGTGAPLHFHNCDEQVTVLDGTAAVEIAGAKEVLHPYDTTYIHAGQPHMFWNRGDEPMKILWIYSTTRVLRTLVGTGKTVEHLSRDDVFGAS
jgi:mannose-6-phosphate isomerase-like protein (cupin superfamily)